MDVMMNALGRVKFIDLRANIKAEDVENHLQT